MSKPIDLTSFSIGSIWGAIAALIVHDVIMALT